MYLVSYKVRHSGLFNTNYYRMFLQSVQKHTSKDERAESSAFRTKLSLCSTYFSALQQYLYM